MNSIERINALLGGLPVDRTPMFEQAVASTVASKILGRRVLSGTTSLHYSEAEILLTGDDDAYEQFRTEAMEDRAALAGALHHDALSLPWLLGAKPSRKLDEFTFAYGDPPNGEWAVRRFDPDAQSFEVVDSWDKELTIEQIGQTVERAEKEAVTESPPNLARLEQAVRRWGSEFAVLGGGGLTIPRHPAWLEATITWPDLVKRYLAAVVEMQKPSLREQKRLGIRVIWGGGDLAGNHGPLYSPRVFREILLPYKRALTDFVHQLGMKYIFRTDGNIWRLGDDFFVNTGTDGYGEIDQDAGMDLVEVHRRYPRLVMWGGVACGSTLHRGTAQQVADSARRCIEGCGGRLILGSSNTIVHGTPVENVMAMVAVGLTAPPPKPDPIR